MAAHNGIITKERQEPDQTTMFIDTPVIRKEANWKPLGEVEIKGKEIHEKNIKNTYGKKEQTF